MNFVVLIVTISVMVKMTFVNYRVAVALMLLLRVMKLQLLVICMVVVVPMVAVPMMSLCEKRSVI